MKPKAILVNADGSVETVDPDCALGLYYFRESKCGECGHPNLTRKYMIHWASSALSNPGKPGTGTYVLIEEPA